MGAFAAGRIINARPAHSQLMGGMIRGISPALHEATELGERLARCTSDTIFGMAGVLLGAGLAWPSLTLAGRQENTRAAAATLLERAVGAERAWGSAHRSNTVSGAQEMLIRATFASPTAAPVPDAPANLARIRPVEVRYCLVASSYSPCKSGLTKAPRLSAHHERAAPHHLKALPHSSAASSSRMACTLQRQARGTVPRPGCPGGCRH